MGEASTRTRGDGRADGWGPDPRVAPAAHLPRVARVGHVDSDKIKSLQGDDHNWPDDARQAVRELLEELRQVEDEAHEAVRTMQERIEAAETERDEARSARDRAKREAADLDREVESLRKRLRIGGR